MRNFLFFLAIGALAAMAFFLFSSSEDEADAGSAKEFTAPVSTLGPGGARHPADLPSEVMVGNADAPPSERLALAGQSAVGAEPILSHLPEPLLCPPTLDSAEAELWKRERMNALHQLSGRKESAAMLELLAELGNPDEGIRSVALDSLEFMRDRAAIPYLEAIVDETKDAKLGSECQELIEFLSLETLTEYLNQMPGQ